MSADASHMEVLMTINGSLENLKGRFDAVETAVRENTTNGCTQAQQALDDLKELEDKTDKKLNRIQGIMYTASVAIAASINAVFK